MKFFKKSAVKKKIQRHSYNKVSYSLVLIVGHSLKDQGARTIDGMSEYRVNSVLANRIQLASEKSPFDVHIIYRDDIGIEGAYLKALEYDPCAIVELHFNAYDGHVNGCEVLICDKDDEIGVNERFFATKMLDSIHGVLRNRKRGVKTIAKRGERGFYNLSRVSSVPSILIEPFFGDNPLEYHNYLSNSDALAESILNAFIDFRKDNIRN